MFTSILRTIVPALWGSFIAWAIGLLPALEPHREALLEYGTPLSAIIAAVLIAAWYAFWRWLEPRLPDWLTRAVLGSAKPPAYEGKHLAIKQGDLDVESGSLTITGPATLTGNSRADTTIDGNSKLRE